MKFQDIVRCKRRELGLTQEQAARRLGVSPAAVSKWESGQSLPDTPLFAPLARLLHTDLNTLRSFEEEPEPARVAQLLNEVARLLPAEGYEAAFAYAMDVLREYPSCDMLAYGFAASLLGGLELAPPAQGRIFFALQGGVLFQKGLRLALRGIQRARIRGQVRHPQAGQAVLAAAKKVAWATRLQIKFGNLKPVRGVAQK